MTTTAQVMRLLAVQRGLDPDICAIAGNSRYCHYGIRQT